MKTKLHNKIEIFINDKKYVFYNKMFKSVFVPLSNFQSYNQYIAIGSGQASDNEKTQKLSNFIKKYKLNPLYLQDNLKNGDLYVAKQLIIEENDNPCDFITEIGLCEDSVENPNIYNYITLISNETPFGIEKKQGQKIIINIYIYLEIKFNEECFLCEGNNKIIDFLLGEGLDENLYVYRGNNLAENKILKKEDFENHNKILMSKFSEISNDLIIEFEADLSSGEINEIVFSVDNSIVARRNLLGFNEPLLIKNECISQENNVIDLGLDIKDLISVQNKKDGLFEDYCLIKKYATTFSDKIKKPFENSFNFQTARFVSKDSKMIFFVKDDYIYGYKNEDYQFKEIYSGSLNIRHIKNIISFDNFVFIVTNYAPYVYAYKIVDDSLIDIGFDFSNFELYDSFENLRCIDFSMTRAGKIIFATILSDGKGVVGYFDYDENLNSFILDEFFVSEYDFSYLLAIYKNNFSDANIMFIKGAEYSYQARIVTYYADKTFKDVMTVLAYDYTNDTKEIFAKDRAVIVEKSQEQKVYIYYYPQVVVYEVPILENEVDNYVSNDLLYLIKKFSNGTFKMFNLNKFNNLDEFNSSFSNFVDESKIKSFEFMSDSLLIFLEDENQPIIALNLMKNCAVIENLTNSNANYVVEYSKFNKLGKNNEGVRVKMSLIISI